MNSLSKKEILFLSDQSEHFSSNLAHFLSLTDIDFKISSIDFYRGERKKVWKEIHKLEGLQLHKLLQLSKVLKNYDYIVIFYVNPLWGLLIPFMLSKKVILVFYGSEFYQSNFIEMISIRLLSLIASKIVFTSDKMKNDMKKISTFQKYYTIRFGNSILPHISSLKSLNSKSEIKKIYGINPNKVTVTVGYNGSKFQNHLTIIDSIGRIPNKAKEKLHLLIPLNYGLSDDYNDEIISRLISIGVDYTPLYEFLKPKEVAIIRFLSDFYINNIETDNMSESVLEYLYADNVTLMTSRVNYDEYETLGLHFERFDDLDAFLELFMNQVESYNHSNTRKNQINLNDFSWELCVTRWIDLLSGLDE